MINTTMAAIEKKKMSTQAMKALAKCCLDIAIKKTGKQFLADYLMHRANEAYTHQNFSQDILASPMNTEKLAYIIVGLLLILEDINYDATVYDVFEICPTSTSTDSSTKKLLIDTKPSESSMPTKSKNKPTKWKPFQL